MPKRSSRLAGIAGIAASLLLSAACGTGSAGPATVDLGTGPAEAGTVKKDALSGVDMTFVSYGGIYQEGQQKAAIDAFAQESGAKILQDGPTDYAKIKAQVDSSNVTWDVVDTDSIWAQAQCGKLLQPLDYTIIDKSKIPEGLASDCSVPAMQYGMVIVYNKAKFGDNPPKDWKDFFDTAKFPGKRGIPGDPGDSAPGPFEAALIADGVAPDQLYPLDVDRALKKLESIRPNLVFWKTGAVSQQLLESTEVDMAMIWNGRAHAAVKNGAPFDVSFEQWMPIMDSLSVPKNAKNPKASMALINYYLGAQQQAKLTELTSYAPINVDAKPNLDETAQRFLPTKPEVADKALKIDSKWWADHQSEMIEKWSAWLGG
ncbi:ABC transporter substrate-binding protein [Nonomuraea sp. NPDC048916]|uniref:ABC transporter substrate-binding protein n=1 Tax=Nonomuraea sp. NPDC048916 TaxID=3154232 RepID=UPI0033E51625